jgi:hypothetical protein
MRQLWAALADTAGTAGRALITAAAVLLVASAGLNAWALVAR